jgi:hypothetical protein
MDQREKYKADCSAEPEEENYQDKSLRLLNAAYHALRSYQHGNQSTELAETLASEIKKHVEGR